MAGILNRIIDRIKVWQRNDKTRTNDKISRVFRFKYSCFKDLLASNTEMLDIITDIEERLRGENIFGMSYVKTQATRSVFHTLRMVKSLDDLSGHHYPMLFKTLDDINNSINEELNRRQELRIADYTLPYSQINKNMSDWVGGKNANLGEIKNNVGLIIPEGFAITTSACDYFLGANDLLDQITRLRVNLDPDDPASINIAGEKIQGLILDSEPPKDLVDKILSAYSELSEMVGARNCPAERNRPLVALRSSAIGEDSSLSFAGQYLTLLNVEEEGIIEAYKSVVASLYNTRALTYRLEKGIRDEDISMSVACIEMIDSEASGVMYSRHPFDMVKDEVLINAVWGLGPYAVDGVVNPDAYLISKDGNLTIISKIVSEKPVELRLKQGGGVEEAIIPEAKRNEACLTDEQVRTLAGYALRLENHYQCPQDIEWALDRTGRLLILQSRPLRIEDILDKAGISAFPAVEGYDVILQGGSAAFPGIGCGLAHHVRNDEDLLDFPVGGVLIAPHSTPQFVVVMKKASAIVTDAGSVTGHMASLAREFGTPTLLGVIGATKTIMQGAEITVDAYSGRIYSGRVPELLSIQRTKDSSIKDTPVYQALKKVSDLIIPLRLVNPKASNFAPEYCSTLHDIMRLVHELSYREMFKISDIVSDTDGAGAKQLRAPIPLDLHIIDLGGGFTHVSEKARFVSVEDITSIPFKAVLAGMLRDDLRHHGGKPIDLGGFFSVMREQMFAPNVPSERFGDRSYAIVSDKYLNFSSRIGYHYSVLDAFCSESTNKNFVTFSFKGGAADDIRKNRRARCIGLIFQELGFQVEVREDRVDARYYKYDEEAIQEKLDLVGRLLQFTRQMDMLMQSEASVQAIAQSFLDGNYSLDAEFWQGLTSHDR